MTDITGPMKSALLWLKNRGGDGVFGELSNNTVLLAAGERAPIMRATWTRLEAAELVERHSTKRLRVTDLGQSFELRGVLESQAR